MQVNVQEILKNIRVQILAAGIFGLLALQFLPLDRSTFFVILLHDALILLLGYSFALNCISVLRKLKKSPIEMVFYILISSVILFLLILIEENYISSSGYKKFSELFDAGTISRVFHFVISILVLLTAGFWFVLLTELFFLKQRRNLNTYYNAMVLFIVLTAFTALLSLPEYEGYQFIHLALFVNTIILIFVNSMRISWIAFLEKNEKKRLLLLSVGIIVFCTMNLVRLAGDEMNFMKSFSPAIQVFAVLISTYGVMYFGFLFFTTLFHLPTAEVFDRKTKEISSLQYFSKLINQALDPNELSETTTELALAVCSVDAAWLITDELSQGMPLAPKNIGYVAAEKIRSQFIKKWGSQITETKFLENGFTTMADMPEEKFMFAALRPLRSHSRVNGYLFVARKGNLPFDSEEKATFETFSDYVSIALENSHLLSESIEKERLERELDVAREIQRKLIPAVLPDKENLDISALFIPAFEVGGDYYDFFENVKNEVAFVIADVSGKGISAAFIMAELRGIFTSLSTLVHSPKELIIRTNQILKRSLDKKHFVTAIFGSFSMASEKLSIVRAGHLPLLRVRGGKMEEITPKGIGLGLHYGPLFGDTMEEVSLSLEPEDLYILYTDGITEAKNELMEDFGMEKLKKIILDNQKLSAENLANKIIHEVTLFSESGTQHDDITLMIFRWNKP